MDTTEKTVEKIRENKCSKEELYEKISGFIKIQQKKYLGYTNYGLIEEGELLSLVWLGIENAISSYSAEKGCKFLSWAEACVKFRIMEEFKKPRRVCLSLDEAVDEDGGLSRGETVSDPDSAEEFLRRENAIDGGRAMAALNTLSDEEREIIELCYIKNLPLSKAAEKMHLTAGRARHLRLAALWRLKNMLA